MARPHALHRVTGDSRSASLVRGVAALLVVGAVARSGPPASHLCYVSFVGAAARVAQRIYFFIFHAIKQSICRFKYLLRYSQRFSVMAAWVRREASFQCNVRGSCSVVVHQENAVD